MPISMGRSVPSRQTGHFENLCLSIHRKTQAAPMRMITAHGEVVAGPCLTPYSAISTPVQPETIDFI